MWAYDGCWAFNDLRTNAVRYLAVEGGVAESRYFAPFTRSLKLLQDIPLKRERAKPSIDGGLMREACTVQVN